MRPVGLAPEVPEDLYMLIKKVGYNPRAMDVGKTADDMTRQGRRGAETPGAKPKGQGLQVPLDSH